MSSVITNPFWCGYVLGALFASLLFIPVFVLDVWHRNCLIKERNYFRSALQKIAGRENEARRAVTAGDHNTTFAIDLASQARISLSEFEVE